MSHHPNTVTASTPHQDRHDQDQDLYGVALCRIDDRSVTLHTDHYPEPAREAALWVAGYLREHCGGRRDILVDRLKKLGFNRVTENYWYRVLAGKYFQVGRDGKITGSVANLVEMVDKLRAGVLLASRAGKTPFIETDTWDRIRDYIDLRRAPDSVCKFGVIIGPTGGQKTECAKHYCLLNNHGTCVHVEAPGAPSIAQFLCDLAKRYTGGTSAAWLSITKLMQQVTAQVNDKKTIIVDNVQRLYKAGAAGNQPVFNFLQKLQEDTGCTIILMVAAISKEFLVSGMDKGFFEQFEGRAGGRRSFLVLDDYTPRADIIAIANAYGIQEPESKPVVKYLEALSREPGRIRILFHWLQEAKRLADAQGEPLTLAHIREVRGDTEDTK